LGLIIDDSLLWKAHIDQMMSKLNTACFVIRTIQVMMSQETLRMVYFAYVHSIMSYGIIWGGNQPHSEKIFQIEKRVIRIITNSRARDSSRDCLQNWKYTVRLLSFRTGIIKSIYVKEMTLLLFSFRHTPLLIVHTDLHGHTASGCLCRSRPLHWCLMYLSWLSGCLKLSQRDTPSSWISVWEQKVISRC